MKTRVDHIAEGVTLFLGDSREIVPTLERVSLVVTDPPYLLTSGGDNKTREGFGGWLSSYGNTGEVVECDISWSEIAQMIYGALKDDADAYIMANDKNVNDAINAALDVGFKFHNLLVWQKNTAVMNRWYMKDCEFTIYLYRGRARMIRDPSSKQLASVPNLRDPDHPTSKPQELMALYIGNSSDPGDMVLDPFMGVGSTGAAAVKLGRRFTGIELEEKYFDIARKRIEAALRSPDMFAASAPKIQTRLFDDAEAAE